LEYFSYYKAYGAYPFFTEGELGYNLRLNEIMNIILDSEVATIYNVNSNKINTIRKLLHLLRESFFVSQIKVNYTIKYSNIGDFQVDNSAIFKIGGKNKSFKQIKDVKNSYVVSDNIEIGFGNKIPLWLFGFLY